MMQRLTAPLVACALLGLASLAESATEAAGTAPSSASAAPSPSAATAPTGGSPPAPEAAELWIAPEDIADRADSAARLIEAAKSEVATTTMLSRVQEGLDQAEPALAEALADAEAAIRDGSTLMAIQDARRQVEGASEDLPSWHAKITNEAKRLAEILEELDLAKQRWSRTLARPEITQAGDAVVRRVDRSLAEIDAATAHMRRLRVDVLALSDRLMDRNTAVREALHKLEDATRRLGNRLLVPNRPPLWGRGLEDSLRVEWPQVPQRFAEFQRVTRAYLELDARPFLLQGLFVVALMFLFRHLPQRVQRRDAVSPMSESTVRLLSRPYAMALLFAILPSPALHPAAPRRVLQLLGILALLPVARILTIAGRRTSLLLYAGLFVLLLADRMTVALAALPTVSLLLFLFEVTLGFSLAFAYRRRLLATGGSPWLVRSLALAMYALGLSLLAEIGGWSALATLTGRVVLAGGVTAVLLYTATISIEALVAFALASPLLRNSRFIDRNQELVQNWSAIGLRLAGLAYWLKIVLNSLGLTDLAREAVQAFLAAGVTAGAVSISVGGVLAFAMTLVAVMIVNRIVLEVLEDEVFPRTTLPRGIPNALLALSRYTIWSLGFLLALASAGVEVGQLAILLGGLGVGIGLGLQDVVKNFAAGITLLLERRVHVGDAVQIPDKDVFGRVLSIGIRASVIRNWNGTEVVMPNDDLVAGAVTNWTLSDHMNRLEVAVGVAYGTDPEAVIALLLKVASEAGYLLNRPPPTALFKAFGESSLDFVLRGWTDEDYEQTGARTSELGLAVHRALREAGIEIPFPQRDVNLMQVSPAASAALRGEREK